MLLPIIQDYLRDVRRGVDAFRRDIERDDIIAAWRDGAIGKDGVLSDGTKYELHGIGCTFYFTDCEVDFDFGVSGRIDGFDFWRLWDYARQFPDRYPYYPDKSSMKLDYDRLVSEQIAMPMSEYSNLYVVKS